MATPTITALAQPLTGNVLVQINWAATPSVTFARVQRVTSDGTATTIRPSIFTDPTGEYMELSGGMAVIYDTEAPFDVPLYYITDGLGDTTDVGTSPEVILGSDGYVWLKDPVNPANNIRVGLTPPPSLPECVPGEGLFFGGIADRNAGTQSTNWSVNNRSTPIPLTQVRAAVTSSLTLIIRTFGDYALLSALLAAGTALQLSVPAKYGYTTSSYVGIADHTNTRLDRDLKREFSISTLPFVTVDKPGGLAYGIAGSRWIDMCSLYPTFADATTAGLTWQGIMLGRGSTVTPPAAFRTWLQVKNDFATWGAVNTGGRTWQQLLEGS